MYNYSQRSLKNLEKVHPFLITVLTVVLRKYANDFVITSGGRTAQQQYEIYKKGRFTAGKIVTYKDGYTNKSEHQAKADGYYYAVDLYPYVNGSIDVEDKYNILSKIAHDVKQVAEELNITIEWGGDWKKPVDKGHFELHL